MAESKKEIRKRILQYRDELTKEDIEYKSEQIISRVLKTPEYEEADNILLYADYRHEVMTRKLFEDALVRKKKIYFPKTFPTDQTMEFYEVISVVQLENGYRGIKEPHALPQMRYVPDNREDTLMIVPGVAFDTQGYRIGYGKGYYDKYLQDKRQITLMGLAFAGQIIEESVHEAHDIRMDKVVTEEIIYSFLRV